MCKPLYYCKLKAMPNNLRYWPYYESRQYKKGIRIIYECHCTAEPKWLDLSICTLCTFTALTRIKNDLLLDLEHSKIINLSPIITSCFTLTYIFNKHLIYGYIKCTQFFSKRPCIFSGIDCCPKWFIVGLMKVKMSW